MILLGELSLWIALLMTGWAAAVSFAGGRLARADLVASGERAVYASTLFVVLASAGLLTALITHDFSLRYVAAYTSANLPVIYTITAFWGGQSGSMLFWCLILALYAAVAVFSNRHSNRELMPWVTGTVAAVLFFFLLTTALRANPFARLDFIPLDGRGLNPQLQNPGMAAHPPNLYLGLVATTIPFAFAVAALVTRRLDGAWLAAVRRWALLSWFFLTVGIVLGMWWAYVELGWGGYWAWDPVENSSLLPWLTGTAFLHSIMVQEKRGMLKKWNVVLVIATFLLSILGTFITRSGVITSVHTFAQSPIGSWFGTFLLITLAVSAYLVATRLRDLEAPVELESMASREAAFLYNNLLLVGMAFSVLWGTLFPILSEAVRGTKITVGAPFFNAVNVPLGLLLLALTGIGPLIAWRKASMHNLRRQFAAPVATGVIVALSLLALGMRDGYALMTYGLGAFVVGTIVQEFYKGVRARRRMYSEGVGSAFYRLISRNRRRYGGYVVHFGVVVLFAGFAGMAFREEFDITLTPGETFVTTDPYGDEWRFTSNGVSTTEALNRIATVSVLDMQQAGQSRGLLISEKRQYVDSFGNPTFEPSTEVGIHSRMRQDVYMIFVGVTEGETAEVRITFNPLVMWVWLGGVLMAVGGLIVMWPQAEQRRAQGGYMASMSPRVAESELQETT